jgi:hypothetical protein
MVSNASEDLPDPDRPVNTIRLSRGRSRSTLRRLCSRAPLTIRRSATNPLPAALRADKYAEPIGRRARKSSPPCYVPAPTRPIPGAPRHSNLAIMTVVDDTYTGHVEPQHATRRTLPGATIIKMSVGPMDNNTYLVTCSRTGETLLIDAANDPELLVKLVGEHAPKLALIVTTHQHFDHWQALEAVASHRRAHRRAPTRRRTTTGRTGPLSRRRRHRQRRRPHLRRDPSARAHPRLGGPRAAADRGTPRHPLVHRRLSVPGRPWADNNSGGVRLPDDGPGDRTSSTSTATTPSYIPVTATTPSSGGAAPTGGVARARLVKALSAGHRVHPRSQRSTP